MKFILPFAAALVLSAPALAQGTVAPSRTAPTTTGTVAPQEGNTGGGTSAVVAPGPTGASTINTDSAAGGNAGQPSRRVPQGSGGGNNQ